jgi:hypothetical protein
LSFPLLSLSRFALTFSFPCPLPLPCCGGAGSGVGVAGVGAAGAAASSRVSGGVAGVGAGVGLGVGVGVGVGRGVGGGFGVPPGFECPALAGRSRWSEPTPRLEASRPRFVATGDRTPASRSAPVACNDGAEGTACTER